MSAKLRVARIGDWPLEDGYVVRGTDDVEAALAVLVVVVAVDLEGDGWDGRPTEAQARAYVAEHYRADARCWRWNPCTCGTLDGTRTGERAHRVHLDTGRGERGSWRGVYFAPRW